MSPEFRAGERAVDVRSICVECGGDADAFASFDDGSGDICETCSNRMDAEPAECPDCGARDEADCTCWQRFA